MEQFRSTLSFVGIGFGSIALVLAVAHFSLGPISPKPTLEQAVADKAVALKQATIAALKGTEAPVARSRELDADRVLSTATAVLGALAMILGVVGYAKKEPLRVAGGAAVLGGGAIAFQYVLVAVVAAFVAVVLVVVLSQLSIA